jgi:hypothetical protein
VTYPARPCPSCGHPHSTRYCGQCGERRAEPDELSFKRFLHALGEELLPGWEAEDGQPVRRAGGRIYRTVYTLFRHPGQLTADYVAGRRRPYMKPVQVFLVVAVIFFLFGHNYFQFRLREYARVPFVGPTAQLFAAEQVRLGLTAAQYEELFITRLEAHKKSVMAVTVPIFALGLLPLFRRRQYGEHLVFSIHFFALQLLFMVTIMFVFFQLLIAIMRGVADLSPDLARAIEYALDSEWAIVVMVYAPMLAWLTIAVRRVYGGSRLVSALKASVLVLWHLFTLLVVFRLGLFFTTYYSIKWFD